MPKTSDDLAKRALGILGKLEAGQTPYPEDMDTVKEVIDPLIGQLGLRGVAYVGDTDQIDDAIFLPLAQRLALEVASDFGLPAVDNATKEEADLPLRKLAASSASNAPVRAEYF